MEWNTPNTVEWETPKTVDWSDEVEDGGLIFGDNVKYGELEIAGKGDDGEKVELQEQGEVNGGKEGLPEELDIVQKEGIPTLEPELPITTPAGQSTPRPPRSKKRGTKPKRDPATEQTPAVERKKTNGFMRARDLSQAGLPPKPQAEDGFEQVVRKQASRGRGRGGRLRGRGRGGGGVGEGGSGGAGGEKK